VSTIWLVRAYTPPLSATGAEVDRHYHFARSLVAHGHRVVLVTSAIARWDGQSALQSDGSAYRDETGDGMTVRILRGRPYQTLAQRFFSMIHFEGMVLRHTGDLPTPDLVLGTTVHPFAAHAGRMLARRHRVPFVLELGDIWPRTLEDMGALSRRHPVYWMLGMLERDLYRKAARIVSKIPYAKVHIGASHADPAKVVYLPNGVDLEPYLSDDYPPAPPVREAFVVTYAGGLTPVYGLENLIDAADIVARRLPEAPITFRLVGSGRSSAELQTYAERNGVSNLQIEPRVPWTEVPALLADTDVCVQVARDMSVLREFGMSANKVYEYLGAARPIIFSQASANDPVAEVGAGISVTPESPEAIADAVIELYGMTRRERIDMGRRGQEFARTGYSMNVVSERFVRIVDEVLGDLPPGSLLDPDDPAA
jgi:glycosyltransferase involved in cell wall biosynthesis